MRSGAEEDNAAVPRILVVDDDPAIREVVRFALSRAGFEVAEAADGAAGLARARDAAPDLIVLDVMLPEMEGTEVCRALREAGDRVPVLFLSSRDDEVDRVVGLEIGGDDYLSKPFSPRELVARVKAILRRGAAPEAPPAETSRALRHGRLLLDPDAARVTWDGAEVALTPTEFGLLRTLMRRPGRVVSRDLLMDGAYAVERVVNDRTIDSHVRKLRAKFAAVGASPIETMPGFGYRLGPCA
ncbi:response regulator [Roseomonas sp. CCTCC AB2023176]|uniref:response regulator n=1 Tax=Roseomonas sp. CCTCC AB2023176 TaxID=3342640 RepID=UPI0035E04627